MACALNRRITRIMIDPGDSSPRFLMHFHSLLQPEAGEVAPSHNKPFGMFRIPFLPDGPVAVFARAFPFVMAIPAFQRLETRAEQPAKVILQKSAAFGSIQFQRILALITPESRRQNRKVKPRGYLQHHTVSISCCNRHFGFANRPPTRTPAIAGTDLAGARPGRRKFIFDRHNRVSVNRIHRL